MNPAISPTCECASPIPGELCDKATVWMFRPAPDKTFALCHEHAAEQKFAVTSALDMIKQGWRWQGGWQEQ